MKYVIYCFIISIFASAQSVHALTSGGLFGEYFTRIVTQCGANKVVSGFSTVPATYGSPLCTTYNDILSSVLGTGVAPVGQALIGFNSDGTPKYGVVDISAYQTIVDLKAQIILLESRITALETKVNPTNGSCGGSSNSCTAGSATGYNAGSCGGNKTWSCLGTNGGTTASCSIPNPACVVAVNGSCGSSSNSCIAGSTSGYNAGSCGGSQTWSCLGSGGGSNASCNKVNPACVVPINGSCGWSANTCNAGSSIGYNPGSCGGSQTWTCQGLNGGGSIGCSIANGACVVPINGVCGGSSNSCNAGSPNGYNAGSCGGSQTWSCLGTNGGSSASCSLANSACAASCTLTAGQPCAGDYGNCKCFTTNFGTYPSGWSTALAYPSALRQIGYNGSATITCNNGTWNVSGASCYRAGYSTPTWLSGASRGERVACSPATATAYCQSNGWNTYASYLCSDYALQNKRVCWDTSGGCGNCNTYTNIGCYIHDWIGCKM